jgi:recombination associated protein RdgC
MKQLIKSATVFHAELPSAAALRGHFTEDVFMDALSLQAASIGFIPREDDTFLNDGANLVNEFAGGVAFTVRIDQKIVPGSVVKAEVDRRAKFIERERGRKPGKKERAQIRDEVTVGFLEHALIRTTRITCYHHTATNFLIVPTTSKALAQQVVSLLVNSVGSVKTTTINVSDVKGGLTTRLKQWLAGDVDAFNGLDPRTEVLLERDDQRVSVKMSDLTSADRAINEALTSRFTVKSLGLSFESDLELKLTDDFKLRGIWNQSAVEEEDPEFDTFAAKAAVEVNDLADAVTFLCEMFGYKEAEAVE